MKNVEKLLEIIETNKEKISELELTNLSMNEKIYNDIVKNTRKNTPFIHEKIVGNEDVLEWFTNRLKVYFNLNVIFIKQEHDLHNFGFIFEFSGETFKLLIPDLRSYSDFTQNHGKYILYLVEGDYYKYTTLKTGYNVSDVMEYFKEDGKSGENQC